MNAALAPRALPLYAAAAIGGGVLAAKVDLKSLQRDVDGGPITPRDRVVEPAFSHAPTSGEFLGTGFFGFLGGGMIAALGAAMEDPLMIGLGISVAAATVGAGYVTGTRDAA